MLVLAERTDPVRPHGAELLVRHGQDDGVVAARLRLGDRRDAVFMLGLFHVNPRVVYVDGDIVVGELAHDVDDAGVAQIRAVFLEGQAHHQHARAFDVDAALQHRLDQLRHHIGAHAVVEAPAGEDDLRVIADRLGLVRR